MLRKMMAAVALLTVGAMAVPVTLHDILGYAGTEKYKDTHAEAVMLTDTDGFNDDATAFLFLEVAGFKDNNAFGIYSYSVDALGVVTVIDQLEVFSGSAEAITSATIHFDLAAGVATHASTNETANIGKKFGLYLSNTKNDPGDGIVGFTWYSHASLNRDGYDHFMIFNTSDNSIGQLLGSDVVVAIEDLAWGGDKDFNDMVIGMSDVIPVSEPAIIGLLGLGLLGLAAIRRRK